MIELLKGLWLQMLLSALRRTQRRTIGEAWKGGAAVARIALYRPTRWLSPTEPDPSSYVMIEEEFAHNLITDAGRDFLHTQGYASSGIAANGLNYVALSNDTLTETAASTTLSNEITTNGLQRTQGVVTHTAGTDATKVTATFNVTGTQTVRKAALFTAGTGGTMNHVLDFAPKTVNNSDVLYVEFTINLG